MVMGKYVYIHIFSTADYSSLTCILWFLAKAKVLTVNTIKNNKKVKDLGTTKYFPMVF